MSNRGHYLMLGFGSSWQTFQVERESTQIPKHPIRRIHQTGLRLAR